MAVQEIILLSVLYFEAAIGAEGPHLYHGPGQEAVLPCGSASPSDTTCSSTLWLYNRFPSKTHVEVRNGKVDKTSNRVSRLSVAAKCSLVVSNVTVEDAGLYTCQQGSTSREANVYLNVLTLSPSPPDSEPRSDGKVTLQCSLARYTNQELCKQNSIRWLDETGAELPSEGVRPTRQSDCVSLLTVRPHSGHNRRYTCQFLERSSVRIEAEYPPVLTDVTAHQNIFIAAGAVVSVGLLVIITAVLMQHWRRPKVIAVPEVPALQKTVHQSAQESSPTYATISHHHPAAPPKTAAKDEERVTYSTIKAWPKPESEEDPGHPHS